MRWNCMSKALHFLQIIAEHQDYPFFTIFLTTKSLSQNFLITLWQILLKLHEHWGDYWRKKLPWMILEEQFPVPRNNSVSKIGNSIISLLWQLQCHCNSDHNKFSSPLILLLRLLLPINSILMMCGFQRSRIHVPSFGKTFWIIFMYLICCNESN